MSVAPSVALPRAAFNPLPIYIALFCLLWSFAFVASKIAVTDCPPPILLTARFSLAGILVLGISALRGDPWSLSPRDTCVFAILGVANNALYLRLSRPCRPDRQHQSGVHRGAGGIASEGSVELAQDRGAPARRCRGELYCLAPDLGRHR